MSFFKPKQNFLSIHPYRTQKNQFCLKVFTSSLISWEIFLKNSVIIFLPQLVGIEKAVLFGFFKKIFCPSTKCQKSGKICILDSCFLHLFFGILYTIVYYNCVFPAVFVGQIWVKRPTLSL